MIQKDAGFLYLLRDGKPCVALLDNSGYWVHLRLRQLTFLLAALFFLKPDVAVNVHFIQQ